MPRLMEMTHPSKKSKREDSRSANAAAAMEMEAADRGQVAAPETEVLGNNKLTESILGFLGYKDIMKSRICCRHFRDAARNTLVPWSDDCTRSYLRETQFLIQNVKNYKAMVAMTTALPNLQQMKIWDIYEGRKEHRYCDGEVPDEKRAAKTAKKAAHDIQMVSNFRQLRHLSISSTQLNGRYPVFFNFPLLQKLEIKYCSSMKGDLKMLKGLPSLKELTVSQTPLLTGNIKSLAVLKNTLEKVNLRYCSKIEGDFKDLADFPLLKSLSLPDSKKITGDLRDVGEDEFPVLECCLELGKGVVGSQYHEFQRISDVPCVAAAIHRLKQRDSFISNLKMLSWKLSRDSPEWYDSSGESGHPSSPFSIDFVQAGSRVGWRWKSSYRYNRGTNSCEINWLDPEPDRESSDYEDYTRELQSLQEDIFCFEGYHQPPSQDEYKRLCEEYYGI